MSKKWDLARFIFLNFSLEIILLLLLIPGLLFFPGLPLYFTIYLIFTIAIVITSYLLFIKTDRYFYRFIILDFAHTIFLAPIVFVLVAGVGGVSQAVVEGVAGSVFYRYGQYTIYTIFILVLGQIFIIPWSLFCNYIIKKSADIKTIKVVLLSLIGIIMTYALLISGCGILFMSGFKPSAKYMFQHHFSTPIDKIQKLRSGGMAWLDNPVCIKFQSKESIVLKDQNLYSPADIAEPRRFFLMECPNDKKILDDTANLICVSYVENGKSYSRRNWLLHNKKTGHYYFLIQ